MATSQELIEKLRLLDTNILAEAANQPMLFIEFARFRVSAMRKRAQAVAAIEQQRAAFYLQIRRENDALGEKATEATISAIIETKKETKKAREEMERAYELEELSKLMLEAARQRRDSIRIIAEGEHAEGNSLTAEEERISARRELSKKVRALEERRQRTSGESE